MDNNIVIEQFRLSDGGISHLLMMKLRLIEDGQYHDKKRITVFMALTWFPLFILSMLAGDLYNSEIQMPFLMDPGPYARYLIALPILLVAHSIINPLVAAVINNIKNSGVLPEEGRSKFQAAIHELTQRRDSFWIEVLFFALALCLSIALLLGYVDSGLENNASSWSWASRGGYHPTPAGWWYLFISGPFLQFLLYRWFWRIGIWIAFLYRVSRIRLGLRATHSDLSGGVGILSRGQNAFIVVFMAVAVMTSSSLAQEILFQGRGLMDVWWEVAIFILIIIVIIEAPLFLFMGQMISSKQRALIEYGRLHYSLSQDFHLNWVIDGGKDMVDSMQPSALADYSAIYETVKNMRIVPIKLHSVVMLAIVILVPFLPLVLTEFSMSEVLRRIAGTLL